MPNSLLDDIMRFKADERNERIATGRALLPVLDRIDQARANVSSYNKLMESQGLQPKSDYTGRDTAPELEAQIGINQAKLSQAKELAKLTYGVRPEDLSDWNVMNIDTKMKGLDFNAQKNNLLSAAKSLKLADSVYDADKQTKYSDAIIGAKSIKELEGIKSNLGMLSEDLEMISDLGKAGFWNGIDYGKKAKAEYDAWLKTEEGKNANTNEKKFMVNSLVEKYQSESGKAKALWQKGMSEAAKDKPTSLFDSLHDDVTGSNVIVEDASGNQIQTDAKKFGKVWKIKVNDAWYTPDEALKRDIKMLGFPQKGKEGDRPRMLNTKPVNTSEKDKVDKTKTQPKDKVDDGDFIIINGIKVFK